MPITDYELMARKAENHLFDHPDISEHSKQILQRFLISYDVSDARKVIFLQKIKALLLEFDPIESALTERDKMNMFFAGLRRRYSPASYATYINVNKRFLTWLNDGDKPFSLKDIKPAKKSDRNRNLKPEDMVSWEDGLLIGDAALSIQIKAAVQIQLDCGFRPSEFIDLNYGDIEVHRGLAVFQVRDVPGHKTGARTVVAHRCVPALLKWLESHPTKEPSDPLWVLEGNISRGHPKGSLRVKRYPYPALKNRVKSTGRRAGILKPLDFYNLRHSSCVLDKMDNLPVDLAAERHGHSVKHFVGTYGRLSVKDVMRRFSSHYNLKEAEKIKQVEHKTCPICKTLNSERMDWCSNCGTPLSTKGALETAKKHGFVGGGQDESSQSEFAQMKAELAASKEREKSFREEQMLLLKQVQEIRSAIGPEISSFCGGK